MSKKVISFDYWNTLVKSNPLFREKQLILVGQIFGHEEAKYWLEKKKASKVMYNTKAINNVVLPIQIDLYRKLLKGKSIGLIHDFMDYSYKLFMDYPPLLNKDITDTLPKLRASGYTILVCSNTLFIPGSIIADHLFNKLFIPKSNCYFSDELSSAKPHHIIFDHIKDRGATLHVGDTDETDGASINFGIPYFKVDKTSHKISSGKKLLSYLNIN